MRFDQLRYLEAIVRLSSFRKAADELGLAQPSISQAIQQLERDVGVRLLDRSRRGIRLTAVGEAVMPHVRAALTAEEHVRMEVASFSTLRRGQLRMGTVTAASNTILPPVIRQFSRRHPGIDLLITETGSFDIIDAVTSGDLEMGVISRSEMFPLPDHLVVEDLFPNSLVICAPTGHPLAARPSVIPADLVTQRLIAFRKGYLLHEIAHKLFGEKKLNIVYYTDNSESAKRMIAAGVGITLLAECGIVDDVLRRSGQIVYVPVDDRAARIVVCAVRSKAVPASSAAEALWRMLRVQARSQPPG